MVNNPRIEPYVRTANTLDKIGLSRQADNVEALMRVGMAMDAGKPLFNNVEEHRVYLDFLRDAKELVSSPTVNERTAGEKAFVLGEIDRYIELWSFMLEEDHKVRLAQKSLPFGVRLGSNPQNDGDFRPEQEVMLSALKPIFRTLWFNAIRETLGKDTRFKVQDEDANSAALSALQQHKGYLSANSKDASGYSFRLSKYVKYESLYELGKAIIINSSPEKNPELVASVRNQALEWLQSSPVVAAMAGNMVSKALEPEMQSAATLEARQKIAKNAKDLLSWFFNPSTNEGKSELVEMPNDTYFPEGLFNTPASLSGNEPGMLWIDDKEAEKVTNSVNPEFSVLNVDTVGAGLPPDEEMPFNETSGPQDETDAAQAPGLEKAPVEAPVTQRPKRRNGKQPAAIPVETPVEEPVEAPAEELVQSQPKRQKGKKPVNEPIQSPVGIDTPEDVSSTDIGMENTNISEQHTPDVVPADEDIANESQGTDGAAPAENPELTKEEEESAIMGEAAAAIIKYYRSKEGTSPKILELLEELQNTVIAGTADEDSAITALAILLNERNNVSISKISPHEPTVQWFKTKDNRGRLLEVAAYHMAQSLELVSDEENAPGAEENAPIQEEHAPGTEATKPGQYDEEAEQPHEDSTYDEGKDEEYRYTGPWPIEPKYLWARRLKKLVKFLAGIGLGAAAIWGVVTQLAPAGAAREAIQTVDSPQSGYSQPMQQSEPQYTPKVQQEPQYTPPVQQPKYTPPVQQPAPQQQVPPVENPKRYNREYYRNFGDGDPRT